MGPAAAGELVPVVKIKQRRDVPVGANDHVTPPPAVSPIGRGCPVVRRLGIGDAPAPAVTGFHRNLGSVNESHGPS